MSTNAYWKKFSAAARESVRATGKPFTLIAAQGREGDSAVLSLWYALGLSTRDPKARGWSGCFGIAVQRQEAGEELLRGVIVTHTEPQAEQAVWELWEAGWTIRARSWVTPSNLPFAPSKPREAYEPEISHLAKRKRAAIIATRSGDSGDQPLDPRALTPFLYHVKSSVSGATTSRPASTLNPERNPNQETHQ